MSENDSVPVLMCRTGTPWRNRTPVAWWMSPMSSSLARRSTSMRWQARRPVMPNTARCEYVTVRSRIVPGSEGASVLRMCVSIPASSTGMVAAGWKMNFSAMPRSPISRASR